MSFERVTFKETYGDAFTSFIQIRSATNVTMDKMVFSNTMLADGNFRALDLMSYYSSSGTAIKEKEQPFNPS